MRHPESALDHVMKEVEGAGVKAVMLFGVSHHKDVIGAKSDVKRLVDAAEKHQAERLVAEEPNRLAAYTVEIDMIEKEELVEEAA
jgi:phosphate:Na+ symporter